MKPNIAYVWYDPRERPLVCERLGGRPGWCVDAYRERTVNRQSRVVQLLHRGYAAVLIHLSDRYCLALRLAELAHQGNLPTKVILFSETESAGQAEGLFDGVLHPRHDFLYLADRLEKLIGRERAVLPRKEVEGRIVALLNSDRALGHQMMTLFRLRQPRQFTLADYAQALQQSEAPEQGDAWWSPDVPDTLIDFVLPNDPAVAELWGEVRKSLGHGTADLASPWDRPRLCQTVYDAVCRQGWDYDYEPSFADGLQRIRPPVEMRRDRVGTCLDFACLFAALLKSVQASPALARFQGETEGVSWAHAVAGCWLRNPPPLPILRDREVIRQALAAGDVLLFEATGAARATRPVAGEVRRTGGPLAFSEALRATEALVRRADAEPDFLVDVADTR